jgi:biopolymer transport protein ExbB
MNFFLQIETAGTAQTASMAAEAAANPKTISVLDLAVKGGWIMIPLLLMSMLAIYIFVERMMTIRKAGKEDSNFMNNIRDCILNGRIDAAPSPE